MKPLPILFLLAVLMVCVLVLLKRLPADPERLVLTPAACAALVPLGLSLPSVPGGCLYTGPVRRDFYAVGLGEFWVARSEVIAEAPLTEGEIP